MTPAPFASYLPAMTRTPTVLVVCALALAACGAETPPSHPSDEALAERHDVVVEEGDEAGADRGQREASAGVTSAGVTSTGAETGSTATTPAARVAPSQPLLALVRLWDVEAEDGHGGRERTRGVAFDLDAHAFPPRALDPVLHVGTLALHHYEHPRVGTLRFVLAEDALPADGAPLFVQYGDDAISRTDLGALDRSTITEAP